MKECRKTVLSDWENQNNKTQKSSSHPRTVVKNSRGRGLEINSVTILTKCIQPAYAYHSLIENIFNLEVSIYSIRILHMS